MKRILTYIVDFEEQEFHCIVDVHYHIDKDFNADADGFRCEERLIIDDVEIIDVFQIEENKFKSVTPSEELREIVLKKVSENI